MASAISFHIVNGCISTIAVKYYNCPSNKTAHNIKYKICTSCVRKRNLWIESLGVGSNTKGRFAKWKKPFSMDQIPQFPLYVYGVGKPMESAQ